MDWSLIKRRRQTSTDTRGVYVDLSQLIELKFRAQHFSFLPRQPVNSILNGHHASRLRGRGLNFEELRRYLPGDDVRTLDWKVTARTRMPHVRVYTEEKDRQVLFLVDQRLNMFFGTRDKLKSVTAAQIAALGLWRALKTGDRVGGIVFNDAELKPFRPTATETHVLRILQTVAAFNQRLSVTSGLEDRPQQLNTVLHQARNFIGHSGLVIIISDFMGADETTHKLIAQMAQHNDVLGFLVHDPARINPAHSQVNVSDGRQQIQLDFSDTRERKVILDDYQKEQQNLHTFLAKLSAPLIPISNQGDVLQQIQKQLGGLGP